MQDALVEANLRKNVMLAGEVCRTRGRRPPALMMHPTSAIHPGEASFSIWSSETSVAEKEKILLHACLKLAEFFSELGLMGRGDVENVQSEMVWRKNQPI